MIDLNKLIDLYGVKGLFLSLFLLIIGGILKSKWISDVWTKNSDKIIEWFLKSKNKSDDHNPLSEADILHHDIFNYIDFWMYSRIPTLQFSTDYRTAIFRKYLSIYLKCYKSTLSDFVRDASYKKMDHSELWKNLLNLINNIIHDYEIECKNSNIPNIIINKMKQKNNDTIQLTIDLIESISTSQFYESDNNLLKVYSILNILLSVLENTISNSATVCNSINGSLRGLKFSDNGKIYIEP